MKQLAVPMLLILNLLATSTVLALAMTGRLVTSAEAVAEDSEVESEPLKPSFYHEFKPELVVNFPGEGRPRYMQIALTAVTFDEEAVAALALHAPVIRNDLLLRFSGQESGPLATREGKEALRTQALQSIREIMKERYGEEAVEDLYITRFVMQ